MECDLKIEAIKQEQNHSEVAIKLVISKGEVISKEKIVIDIEPEVESPVWPDFLKSKVDSLVESHEESGSQLLDQTLVNKMFAIKQGDSSVSIRTEDVLNFVSQHSKQFHKFAKMQKYVNIATCILFFSKILTELTSPVNLFSPFCTLSYFFYKNVITYNHK
jgi:hypothetical protein